MQSLDVIKTGAAVVLIFTAVRLVQTKTDPDSSAGRALAFLFR